MDPVEIAWIVLAVVFIPVFAFFWWLDRSCPKCKRVWAMRRTGRKETGGGGFFSSSWKDTEWQCKWCHYVEWEQSND